MSVYENYLRSASFVQCFHYIRLPGSRKIVGSSLDPLSLSKGVLSAINRRSYITDISVLLLKICEEIRHFTDFNEIISIAAVVKL
jgi:hypothetical protein